MPPGPSTRTGGTVAGTPNPANSSTVAAPWAAEPSCSPWSTTTAHASARTARVAAASASESAPPEQATTGGAGGSAPSASRTARVTTRRLTSGHAVDPAQPGAGLGQLGPRGQRVGARPDRVEPVHAGSEHHVVGERL